jgi:hypothetical protein
MHGRRFVLAVAAAAVALGAAGCNGGSGGAAVAGVGSGTEAMCALMARLDETGKTVASADVQDPARFSRALAGAVKQYTEITRDLRRVVPDDLRDDVERLQAAVEQYRFNDAVDDHAALEAYATRECS